MWTIVDHCRSSQDCIIILYVIMIVGLIFRSWVLIFANRVLLCGSFWVLRGALLGFNGVFVGFLINLRGIFKGIA